MRQPSEAGLYTVTGHRRTGRAGERVGYKGTLCEVRCVRVGRKETRGVVFMGRATVYPLDLFEAEFRRVELPNGEAFRFSVQDADA